MDTPSGGVPVQGITWFNLTTWILVVAGWIILNWQNNRREERKEIRAALTYLVTEISSLEKMSIKYHKSTQRNEKIELKISSLEKKLSEHLSYLRLRNSAYTAEYSAFVDSIMLENFQSAAFTQKNGNSEFIERIRDNASELESALELEFSNLFRGSFATRLTSSVKHTLELRGAIPSVLRFLISQQQAIITLFAYIFLACFFGYVLSLVPAKP
ncbi:hypothetical protein [Pseudomonas sp. W5-01]|uniref:hypothetical protein n=1 Tax=Pseudomonas sp. W5-01 TaxID=3097454 RepID=UPI00397C27C9